MAANPMYQFNVYRIGPEIKLGEVDISFTNASLFMVISSLAILIIFNCSLVYLILYLSHVYFFLNWAWYAYLYNFKISNQSIYGVLQTSSAFNFLFWLVVQYRGGHSYETLYRHNDNLYQAIRKFDLFTLI